MIKIKRKVMKEQAQQQNPFFDVPNIQNTMDAVAKKIGSSSGIQKEKDVAAILKAIKVDQNTLSNAVKLASQPPAQKPTGGLQPVAESDSAQQSTSNIKFSSVTNFPAIANQLKTDLQRKVGAERNALFLLLLKSVGFNQKDFDLLKSSYSSLPSAQPTQQTNTSVK